MTDRRFIPRDLAVPAAIIAALAAVSSLGFRAIFGDWTFVSAAVIGALGATLMMLVGRWARLSVTETLAVSLVGFVLLGAVAAEGVPTPGAFGTFFDGLIDGWAQVLSSTPPADLTAEFRVLPFATAWFGAAVGGEILRSARTPGLAVLGPVASLTLAMLVTLEDRNVALTQGLLMVAGALILSFIQQRRYTREAEMFEDFTIDEDRRSGGVVAALAVAALIAVAAPLVGPRLPLAEANERFDLRDYQRPPFDPLEQPSPLVQLKTALQDRHKDNVLFKVRSDQQVDRFVLAVLDDYTGEFWAVADEDGDAPAEFRPIDSAFPGPLDADIADWERASIEVEIVDLDRLAGGDYDPAWLPTAGWPVSFESDDITDVRFNRSTGTVAVAPDGPTFENRYTIVSAIPPDPASLNLGATGVTPDESFAYVLPTAALRDPADNILEGKDGGLPQLSAIQSWFVDIGAYDSAENSVYARPGHALKRLGDFLGNPDVLAGFEEQYAATAALIARSENLPARVVVGYLIQPNEDGSSRWVDGELEVLGSDMGAWIEVRVDDHGWLPFDVTPPRTRTPDEQSVGRSEREVAVPNPPPDPPPPVLPPQLDREDELEEEVEDEEEEDDNEEEDIATGGGFPVRAIAIGAAASSPAIAFLTFAGVVVFLKRRRTSRRRNAGTPSRRVAGAWYEVVDRYREVGVPARRTATAREIARGLAADPKLAQGTGPMLLALADDVDRAAFHPEPALDHNAAQAWAKSDEIRKELISERGLWSRLRHRLDPRPLLRKDPLTMEETPEHA